VKTVRLGTGSRLVQLEVSTPFDALRRTRADGTEYWSARDLMILLGYPRWQPFDAALERAIASCEAQNHDPDANFLRLTVKTPNGRPADDVQLSRFGAYLTAMNGDPRKPEVAIAQGYFAVKTREAELRADAPKMITNLEMLAQIVGEAVKLEQRTATLEAQNRVLQAKLEAQVQAFAVPAGHFTVTAWARLFGVLLLGDDALKVGRACSRLCRERGLEISKTPDERYGFVNTYPEQVIEEVWMEFDRVARSFARG
jgi:DNA-damage-inducible protein D